MPAKVGGSAPTGAGWMLSQPAKPMRLRSSWWRASAAWAAGVRKATSLPGPQSALPVAGPDEELVVAVAALQDGEALGPDLPEDVVAGAGVEGARAGVDERVVAVAAHRRQALVLAGAGEEDVVAGPAVEAVVARPAGEQVVAVAAEDDLVGAGVADQRRRRRGRR